MDGLNKGQTEAAEAFFAWLFTDEPEYIISGGGGVGKTHLMSKLIDKIIPDYLDTCKLMGIDPSYDTVVMTATTNKAAEVLAQATKRPTSTIHSFMALRVADDYTTGRSKITKTDNWKVHTRTIIFIDECSMVDSHLRAFLKEGTHKCKIVYVGDHCQLAPIMETISPIYRDDIPYSVLTEPMRNRGQPALMNVCQQLRETVETGIFKPIQLVPGVIDRFDGDQMEAIINATFVNQTKEERILAYTNQRVIDYNDYVRDIRQLPPEYQDGELLINNSAIRIGKQMLSVEEEVEIMDQRMVTEKMWVEADVEIDVRYCTLRSGIGMHYYGVPLPVDREHYKQLLQYYQRMKKWHTYFRLKNTIPDLRQRDAATIHKSQGSTYNTVFIDADNLSSCHQPAMGARLLYVAFTRARNRIVLYGSLSAKFGGLLT